MKSLTHHRRRGLGSVRLRCALLLACALFVAAIERAAADTWDNSTNNGGAWSTANNWADNSEPTSADAVIFPTPIPFGDSTISLSTGEQAANLTFNDSYSLGGGSLTLFGAGGNITVASAKTATITSTLNGSVGLTKLGTGTLVLNPTTSNGFTGDVAITGTLSINKDSSLGNSANDVTIGAGASTGTLVTTLSLTTSSSRVISPGIFGGTISASSGTVFTMNGALGGASNPLTFSGAGTVRLIAASSRSGSNNIQNGTVRIDNATALGSGGTTITNNGIFEIAPGLTTSAFISLGHTGTVRTTGVGAVHNGTISVQAAATTFVHSGDDSTHTLTIGDIDGGSGSVALVTGLGTVTLSGAGNNYTGQWSVSSGTLRLAHVDAITSSSSPVVIGSSGTVIAETASNYAAQWTVNGLLRAQNAAATGTTASTANVNGGGTLQVENVNLIGNAALNSGGTIKGIGTAAISGTVTASAAVPTVTLATGATSTDTLTVSNYTGGSGSTTHISGAGTVTLSVATPYAGGWVIDSGTLRVENVENVHTLGTGSSPIIVNTGGTLHLNGGVVLTRAVNMNNGSTLKGGPVDALGNAGFVIAPLSVASGAQVNFVGAQSITNGSLTIGNFAEAGLTGGGGGANITISGGTVRLNGPSDYTGGWIIGGSDAQLLIANDGQLGNPLNPVTFAAPFGRLDTFGPITTSRQFNINGSFASLAVNDTLTLNTGLAGSMGNTFSIGDTGTLVLNAAGTWNGAEARVGSLATLKVNHNAALGTTPLRVEGAIVELGSGVTLSQSLKMFHAGVLRGNNNAAYNGTITVMDSGDFDDVILATATAGDVFTIGNGANDLTGGGPGSTITAAGPGTIVLPFSNNVAADWNINGGTVRVTGSGNGLGTGLATVNNAATLELSSATVSSGAIILNDGATLKGAGTSTYSSFANPQVTNGSANVFMNLAGGFDVLTINSAIRSVNAAASSATIHFNGAGKLVLRAGATSGADIFGGSWEQSGGILQVGDSAGNSINALGFKNGDAKQANSIRVNNGILAVGVVGSGASTPQWLRANVTLNGGSIASINGVDAQYGGDFVVEANSTSHVLVYDPLSPATPRTVSLVAGGLTSDSNEALTHWRANSTLIVDATTTGGVFNIARDGGTISVAAATPTLQINAGATVNLGGAADALSDGTNHVNVVNNSTTSFNVTQGSKNIGSLSGVGNTSISAGASLTVHQNGNTSYGAIAGAGSLIKEGAGTLTASSVAVGALTINGGALSGASIGNVDSGETITVAGGSLSSPSIIDNGTVTVTSGTISVDLLAAGNDGTLSIGSGTGNVFISGGTVSAREVLLGSSAGGNGNLTISGTGGLESERLAGNDLIVNGGSVTITPPAVPAEDPMEGSIVAGYVHDGAVFVNGGTVTTPKLKLGMTPGKFGTYSQTSGTVNVTTFGVGNDGNSDSTSGVGNATISGGTLNVTNLIIGSAAAGVGNVTWSGGTLDADGITIVDGGTMAVWENGDRTLHTDNLSITGTGKLDLADNDLVVNNGVFSDVQTQVISGFGTSGPGIISSTSDGSQILALFDNALVGATDWQGTPIGPNAIVGKYTYFGDANIDGQVTGDDYTVIDANLNTTPPIGLGWLSGDMNLDEMVTGDDYTVIDANLGLGMGNPLSPNAELSAVPESSVGIGVGAAVLLSRRRRRINHPSKL